MESLSALLIAAIVIGVTHTLMGPDHYLPFIAISKARNWTYARTINVVILCGMGHVLSSVVIGFFGIGAGILLGKVEVFEGYRGNVAAWLLFSFGVAYTTWAIIQLIKKKHHHHAHASDKKKLTFWILFAIFVFGPCEPLIPILMYPAFENNLMAVGVISLVFLIATVSTMIITVTVALKGISFVKMHKLEKYQHLLAGAVLTFSGAGILFLGF